MRINKLAKEVYGVDLYYRTENNPSFVGWDRSCTGKTTSTVLGLIKLALDCPNCEILIKEENKTHHQLTAHGGTIDVLKKVIKKLDLRFMEVSHSRCSLTYNLFEEVQAGQEQEQSELDVLKGKLMDAAMSGDLEAVTVYSQAIQRLNATK